MEKNKKDKALIFVFNSLGKPKKSNDIYIGPKAFLFSINGFLNQKSKIIIIVNAPKT